MKKKNVAVAGRVSTDQWVHQVQDGLQRLAKCMPSLPNPIQPQVQSTPSTPSTPSTLSAGELSKQSDRKQQSLPRTSSLESSSSQSIPSSSKLVDNDLSNTTSTSTLPSNNHKSDGENEKKERIVEKSRPVSKKLALKDKLKKNPLFRFKM